MVSIRLLPEFTSWIDNHKDGTIRTVIVARIKRLGLGLMGDVAPVSGGVSELRIHIGAGWRVYFTQHGSHIIVILCGGTKRSQNKDIIHAKAIAARIEWTEQTP